MLESTRHLASLLLVVTLCLPSASCERCGSQDGPRVPFKLTPNDAGADAGDAAVRGPISESYARDAGVSELEGVRLPWTAVRAALATDLDQDGDHDALALTEEEAGTARIVFALRDGERFEQPREIARLPVRPELAPCTIERAEFSALSASKAQARFERSCGASKLAEPSTHVLLSLEATPRVLESITQRPSSTEAPMALTFATLDSDADGHDDIVLTITPPRSAAPEATLQLVWFDRASGLVRDLREPETTLSAWAAAARTLASKSPEQAAEKAATVLAIRRALCREGGSPLLWFSGSPGVVCGPGKSEPDALLALSEAQARLSAVREALDAYRALKGLSRGVDERALQKIESALASLPAAPGIMLRRGARVEPLHAPVVHLPAARFLSETTLLLTRREPVLYDLVTGEESPAQVPADALVRDPAGQLAVTAVEHACTGYSLRVERAPALGEPYLRLPGGSSVPLLHESNPPDCGLKSAQRARGGSFLVLGWAPQGVVLSRGSEVHIVPLDLAGKPAGEPRTLDPATPLPAPLPSGAATPDGARYVEATPFGVVVYAVRSGEVELWRPEGYLSLGKAAREAAVSPSGRRVAVVLADNTFYWMERAP